LTFFKIAAALAILSDFVNFILKKNNMKTITLSCCALAFIMMSSSALLSSDSSAEYAPVTCPFATDFHVVKFGSGKPLYPGEHTLQTNTSYAVWARGSANSESMCVTAGSGYTIVSLSNCEDIGYGDIGQIADIHTASSGSGVAIRLEVTCTSGNGSNSKIYGYAMQ
jgi:hypothetical protein